MVTSFLNVFLPGAEQDFPMELPGNHNPCSSTSVCHALLADVD